MRYWWALRVWWHLSWFHTVSATMDEHGGFLVECSCGGQGYVKRNTDETMTVTVASCPLWTRFLGRSPTLVVAEVKTP